MGLLKFLVWTGCAVGLGLFLATAQIGGRTPWEAVQRAWRTHVQPARAERLLGQGERQTERQAERQVDRVKDSLREALDEAQEAVHHTTRTASTAAPRERITHEDRAAIERIIAQKK